MIARLTGALDSVGEDYCILDVGGVGYHVQCGARTLRALPPPGEVVRLAVVTRFREDRIDLYGFTSAAERDWFTLLQTVQGVGAKVALAILSVLAPQELADAIAAGDKAQVGRAQGVGPKLAQRICAELKDKAAGQGGLAAAPAGGLGAAAAEDAIGALLNLGYKRAEAFAAVMKVGREREGAGAADLIRAALKELAP